MDITLYKIIFKNKKFNICSCNSENVKSSFTNHAKNNKTLPSAKITVSRRHRLQNSGNGADVNSPTINFSLGPGNKNNRSEIEAKWTMRYWRRRRGVSRAARQQGPAGRRSLSRRSSHVLCWSWINLRFFS